MTLKKFRGQHNDDEKQIEKIKKYTSVNGAVSIDLCISPYSSSDIIPLYLSRKPAMSGE
ncbi:MAG: hypothetical protein ACK4ND_06860 [Cytophagaceae bacterium]